MEKGILLLENDPEIKGLIDELETLSKAMEERVTFIKKQLETASREHNESREKVWTLVKDTCLRKGLLPADYSKDKYFMRYGNGVLYCGEHTEDGPDNNISAILKKLFDGV